MAVTAATRVATPDLERYPRFAQALAAAETVDVEPGDAIFVPNLWWHNVEAVDMVNLSVNYWWLEAPEMAEPFVRSQLIRSLTKPMPARLKEQILRLLWPVR